MSDSQPPISPGQPAFIASIAQRWLVSYLWLIFKNLLGWALIVSAFVLGAVLPGPNGLIQFILGFALISFPGKRRATARVLRGRPIEPGSWFFRVAIVVLSVLLPGLVLAYLDFWLKLPLLRTPRNTRLVVGLGLLVACALCVLGLNSMGLFNKLLRGVAIMRRRVRPWLRRRGIDLLPPRRRRRHTQEDGKVVAMVNEEVLELHERHVARLYSVWQWCWPWLRRLLQVAVVAGIFALMLRPVLRHWPVVRDRILSVDWYLFVLAAGMFAVTSLVFRVPSWRWVLRGLGADLPPRPAMRIWSTSEMVRYVPGVIWQVLGRVYLARPYGMSASICSVSQVLEITLFVMANVLVALVSLLAAGISHVPAGQRQWVWLSAGLLPVLAVLLYPRVFFGLLNSILGLFHKPQLERQLPARRLVGLVLWLVAALLWQTLAVWVLTHHFIGLPLSKWWVLAGSYCLAWTVGFCFAWLAPAGLGVRELVFVAVMSVALPPAIRAQFDDPKAQTALLNFVGVLLRLWTIAGELIVLAIAYAADYRRQGRRHPAD